MIVRCKECKHPVSTKADKCPYCGYVMTKDEKLDALIDSREHPIVEETNNVNKGSFAFGLFLSILLSLVGFLIALVSGEEDTKYGAILGIIIQIVAGFFVFIVLITTGKIHF